MHPRRLVVEFFGAFVRRTGGWTSSRAAVAALATAGLDEAVTRTTLSRLKGKGWLVAEQRDGLPGYGICEQAQRSYESGDEVVWRARTPAPIEDGWVVISVSVPEPRRATRQALRSRLTALGFGNTNPGTWVAPAAMSDAAAEVLAELGLTGLADRFLAHYEPHERTQELVQRGWDLTELSARYREFVDAYAAAVEQAAAQPGANAEVFALYARVIHAWRPLAFRDPALPLQLMPVGWNGEEARSLFDHAREVLDEPALDFVRSLGPVPV